MPRWLDDEAALGLIRVLVGIALLLKFTTAMSHRGVGVQSSESYIWYRYLRRRGLLPFRTLRILFGVAVLASVAFTVGIATAFSALAVAVWLSAELRLYFRFHTCFLLLLLLIFGARPLLDLVTGHQAVPVVLALIAVTTTVLYLTSAVRKARSRQFRSGRVIQLLGLLAADQRDRGAIARVVAVITRPLRERRIALLAAVVTIVAEAVLPFGLAFGPFSLFVVVGLAMHLCFSVAGPRTLAHFALATAATYLAFPFTAAAIRSGF